MLIFSLLVLLCLLVDKTFGGDGIFWSNKDDFKLKSIDEMVRSATPENRLLIFIINGDFHLASFSHLAGVYADGKSSQIPNLSKVLHSSRTYGAEWISGDLSLASKHIIRDKSDDVTSPVDAPSVVLVRSDSLKALDKSINDVLRRVKDKPYCAILLGEQQQSEKRYKRYLRKDDEPTTELNPYNNTATYVNGTDCLLYIGNITIRYKGKEVYYEAGNRRKSQWLDVVIDTSKVETKTGEATCSFMNSTFCNTSICGDAIFVVSYTGAFNGSWNDTSSGTSQTVWIYDVKLELKIELSKTGYWHLTQISIPSMTYGVNGGTQVTIGSLEWKPARFGGVQIYSVPKFAWACYQSPKIVFNTSLVEDEWGVQFGQIIVQPFLANVVNGTFTNKVDDCVGFFTAGIWMGWIVGVLMILIFLYGMAMMTNLKTVDRFDDPKATPLQINAKE